MNFARSKYIISALDEPPTFKGEPLPEIAFVGRSNVGKSSLINHLTGIKELARISTRPGKTQTLNFFSIDEQLLFVDLPGYGYARVPGKIRKAWGEGIDRYLNERKELTLILFLLDIKRPPSSDDLLFYDWCTNKGYPFLLIFTKCDRFKPSQLNALTQPYLQAFKGCDHIHYTVKEASPRKQLRKILSGIN